MYIYTSCDGRDNTKKLCGFISIMVPQKKFFVLVYFGGRGRADVNQQNQKTQSLNLIRSHVSIVTTATITLITNIAIAIVIIAITKNDCHNNNNSDDDHHNNNNNNNNNNHNNNNNNNNNDNNKGTNSSNNI